MTRDSLVPENGIGPPVKTGWDPARDTFDPVGFLTTALYCRQRETAISRNAKCQMSLKVTITWPCAD